MTNQTRVQWQDVAAEDLPPLPAKAEAHACLPDRDLVVICGRTLLDEMARYFGEERQLERLALLLGRVWRRRGDGAVKDPVVSITEFRSVAAADSSVVHVRMAPRDWPGVWAAMGGRQIVGWAHSHPGHGLCPSKTDLAMQRRWFAQPWALAMIFDPCAGTMATYAGRACTPTVPVQDAELTALLS